MPEAAAEVRCEACREHKFRKLHELQEELQALESDIVQVEARAGGNGLAAPWRMTPLRLPPGSMRSLRDALLKGTRQQHLLGAPMQPSAGRQH